DGGAASSCAAAGVRALHDAVDHRAIRGAVRECCRLMTLPNFLIIGAARAGTTSLYHYLRQHPDIFMSRIKETNYYTDEDQILDSWAVRSRAKYEELFAGANGERAIGEATPKYLNAITGVERIHADLPGVRQIGRAHV